jgi:hypothetical protein
MNVQPGTAKPAFSPLTLTLATNTALAPLLTMAGTGPVDSTSATLIGVRADGEPITFQLDLGPVFVTKVEDVAGAGLTVSLGFGRITLHSVTLDPSGVVSPGKEFFWDPLADSVPTAFQSIPPSNTSITDVPATFQAIRPSNTSITGSLPARSLRPISCSSMGSTAARQTSRTRVGSRSPASISILRT